jgi:hypothetical protein
MDAESDLDYPEDPDDYEDESMGDDMDETDSEEEQYTSDDDNLPADTSDGEKHSLTMIHCWWLTLLRASP